MDRKKFRQDVKSGASFTDWRKDGKFIGFVHPDSEIEKRTTVSLRYVTENDEGEEEIQWIRRFYFGDKDPLAKFLKWLSNADEIDADEVVLRLETAGGDVEEYTKGDLLGLKGYDWRKRLLRNKTEYLFCVANVTEKGSKAKGPEILTLPYSAGKKLNKVWDNEIEENGEDEGDPWVTPYSFRVTYDPDERGTDMYDAGRASKKMNPDVQAIFDEPPIDLKQYCDPENEDLSAGTTAELLARMCVVDCPVLEVDREKETPKKPAKKKAAKKKVAAKKAQKPEEKKELKKVAKKPKAPVKPKGSESEIDCSVAEPDTEYEYDDEVVTFVKFNKAKNEGLAKDEDGFKVRIPGDAKLKVIGESQSSSGDSDSDDPTVRVEDCEKGKYYYTQEGVYLKFVRYNHSKEKGVFADAEEERIFIDGSEIVSLDVDEDDPLAPIEKDAEKDIVEDDPDGEENEEPEDDSDGEEMTECPACDKLVSESATVCPHCGVEYADDEDSDDEEDPF
jgi:hypothetical protein